MPNRIRVQLPSPLCVLAHLPREITLEQVAEPITPKTILDALEAAHPRLIGTLRDRATHKRRPLVRFFACEQDLSHDPLDTPLPEKILTGEEPFIILGAIAGG